MSPRELEAPAPPPELELRPGDPVWYRRRASSQYGLFVDVPGLVVRRTDTRVTLRTFPASLEAPARVVVHPSNVRRRPPHDCGRPDCRECTATRSSTP